MHSGACCLVMAYSHFHIWRGRLISQVLALQLKDIKPAAGLPLDAVGTATETVVNTSAVDVLRRLPGVTEGNYRDLMQAAGAFMHVQIASYMPFIRMSFVLLESEVLQHGNLPTIPQGGTCQTLLLGQETSSRMCHDLR